MPRSLRRVEKNPARNRKFLSPKNLTAWRFHERRNSTDPQCRDTYSFCAPPRNRQITKGSRRALCSHLPTIPRRENPASPGLPCTRYEPERESGEAVPPPPLWTSFLRATCGARARRSAPVTRCLLLWMGPLKTGRSTTGLQDR